MRADERARLIVRLVKRDGPGCFYCKEPLLDEQVTIDHYIPLSAGGTWDFSNLRIACFPCNNRKGDIVPDGKRHPVPAPRQKKRTRVEKVKIKKLRIPCESCKNGRTLDQGLICTSCGREPLPPAKSHLFRARLGTCDHESTWCMMCVVFPEDIAARRAV